MRKIINNKQGITLVALVITIVIILILAGISISALIDNKIFLKAKNAKDKQINAEEKENLILSNYKNT